MFAVTSKLARCSAKFTLNGCKAQVISSLLGTVIRPSVIRSKSTATGMFVDRVRLSLSAGSGGPGCISFSKGPNKESVPPDGGNGGNGGSIWLEAQDSCVSLRMSTTIRKAPDGGAGHSEKCKGKSADDLVIAVPPGTVARLVREDGSVGSVVCDLDRPQQRACVAQGGMGGRGNAVFRSSTNRSPNHAQPGHPGEHVSLELELKTIADVGLVGLPNAGKSTFLRAISHARPRVASYPFTTLRPFIGVVDDPRQRFTVADIPGLIEGAHENKGLGHEFLRHVERTYALLYVVDVSDPEILPMHALQILRDELEMYQAGLSERVCAVVANKMDADATTVERLDELVHAVGNNIHVFPTAAVLSHGVQDVVDHLIDTLHVRLPIKTSTEQPVYFERKL